MALGRRGTGGNREAVSVKTTTTFVVVSLAFLGPGTGMEELVQGASQHLQRGVELLDANQPQAAIAELDQAVELEPGNPRIRYYLGRALYLTGQYEKALEHLTTGLPVAADPSAFGLIMGQSLIELDRLNEARSALDGAAALRPDYPPIQLQLAQVCYRAGNVDAALQKLAETAELAPQWTVPRLQAASIAAEKGDAATAAELFASTLDISGDLPLIWVRLGDNLEANLDYEGAIQAYRSAIATSPDLLAPQLALAYLFFNRQQFDDAATVLAELLQRVPGDPQILLPVGEIQMIEGQHEAALETIQSALRALERAPAATLQQVGSQRDGLRLRALELQAKTLTSLDRVTEAEAAARTLLAMNPSNLDGLFVLGTVLLRSGNQEGRDHLRRFQRLSDVREHRELAYDFYRRGRDPDRAVAEFEKALVIEPQDAATLTGLGTVRLAQGNAAAAVELLAQAREAGAASVEWYREWILALHAAERSDEATQVWQQVREAGVTLGPRVWAALGNHQGAC